MSVWLQENQCKTQNKVTMMYIDIVLGKGFLASYLSFFYIYQLFAYLCLSFSSNMINSNNNIISRIVVIF